MVIVVIDVFVTHWSVRRDKLCNGGEKNIYKNANVANDLMLLG